MISVASMGLSTLQGLRRGIEPVDRMVHNQVDSYLEPLMGV